jgi:hypothetical protein
MIVRAGESHTLLREWSTSCDAFSTTLIFGVRLAQPATANDDSTDAFVRVHFGTAWNSLQEDDCQDVDVDLCQGTAITVLGNCMLSVEIIYGPLIFPAQDAVQPTLDVSLSIAHGFNPKNARRTVKLGPLGANATSAVSTIPNFARDAILVNGEGAVPSLRLDQFNNLTANTLLSTDFVTKKPDQAVSIANGASAFSVTTGATPTTKTAVIWRLNL